MNIHKNARLTFIRRVEMVQDVVHAKLPVSQVATHYEVSAATVRKWVGRFLAEGRDALMDRSSRPARSPRGIDGAKALTIVELRKKRMTQARIAQGDPRGQIRQHDTLELNLGHLRRRICS